jgi:hypothetical protein
MTLTKKSYWLRLLHHSRKIQIEDGNFFSSNFFNMQIFESFLFGDFIED